MVTIRFDDKAAVSFDLPHFLRCRLAEVKPDEEITLEFPALVASKIKKYLPVILEQSAKFNVVTLDLSSKHITNVEAQQIAKALERGLESNITMKKVILSDNNIRDTGVCLLAKAMEANPQLDIVLAGNVATHKGVSALVGAAINTKKTTLDLTNLSLNYTYLANGVKALLGKVHTIQTLIISQNRITPKGEERLKRDLPNVKIVNLVEEPKSLYQKATDLFTYLFSCCRSVSPDQIEV